MNLFTDNPDFYPTPNAVIEQMMMGEDFVGKTILEPSAGKGNIVDWLKTNGAREVIACENDPYNLKLLRGKCQIIANDFLTVTSDMVSHIDMIVMNPPFSRGAEHILHAFEIAPPGCTVIALCNDSNLEKSSWNKTNAKLLETVNLYGRSEFLGDVFKTAERRTNVHVSLVKLYKEGNGEDEFAGYFFDQFDTDIAGGNTEGLMQYNFVRDIVNRYVSAVKLFDNVLKASKEINEMADFYDYRTERDEKTGELKQVKQTYGYLPVKFGAIVNREENSSGGTTITHQEYKKSLQKHYWHIIFRKMNMEKYATKQLREQINNFVEQQSQVLFTMGNIYKVIDMVVQTNGQRMQRAIMEAFDKICSLSAENSTAGETWKTNANYMVNKRFIVDWMTRNDYSWEKERLSIRYRGSGNVDIIEDVHKALCYLTGTNFDDTETLSDAVNRLKPDWGKWFEWGFFKCIGYKKGTMHFEFLDEDVWLKFNETVAKQRGWSLPKKSSPKARAKKTSSKETSLF